MSLASGFRLLFSFARQQEALQALWQELVLLANQEALLTRIKDLAAQEQDLQYENSHDVAFVMYLWLLSWKNPELALQAAEIISKVPKCAWAEDGARYYLEAHAPLSEAPDAPTGPALKERAVG